MTAELLGLFAGAFFAATLLPGGSEAGFVALAHLNPEAVWLFVLVATVGNTLGGLVSFGIGRAFSPERLARPAMQSALERVRRFGAPALLAAWVPIIGDPLCVAAGWVRLRWWPVVLYMTIGKAARYAALALFFI